jgi:hypothetical protein
MSCRHTNMLIMLDHGKEEGSDVDVTLRSLTPNSLLDRK